MKYTPFITYSSILALSYILVNPAFTFNTPLMVLLGFAIWNSLEYVFHRYIFHERILPKKLNRIMSYDHIYHHRKPKSLKNLFLPIWLTSSISAVIILILLLIFSGANVFWAYVGVVLGYFLYECMHYSAHHLTSKLPFLKQMRAYHAKHHHSNPNAYFMVSFPLFDWLFTRK